MDFSCEKSETGGVLSGPCFSLNTNNPLWLISQIISFQSGNSVRPEKLAWVSPLPSARDMTKSRDGNTVAQSEAQGSACTGCPPHTGERDPGTSGSRTHTQLPTALQSPWQPLQCMLLCMFYSKVHPCFFLPSSSCWKLLGFLDLCLYYHMSCSGFPYQNPTYCSVQVDMNFRGDSIQVQYFRVFSFSFSETKNHYPIKDCFMESTYTQHKAQ